VVQAQALNLEHRIVLDIDKRIKILKAINEPYDIEKEAGLFTAITSVIGAAFSDVFNPEDISGSLMKIATTAVMGYFFGIWWSIATAVLQYGFGIDIKVILTTINSILSKFISTVFSSGTQREVDVDRASEELTAEVMDAANVSGPSLDEPIGNVITADQQYELVKQGGIGGLARLFGGSLKGFMQTTSGGFLKKIIGTIIKGLLVGSGIGVGTAAVMRGTKPGARNLSETLPVPDILPDFGDAKETVPTPKRTPQRIGKSVKSYVGRPSNEGRTYHVNDADVNGEGTEAWYIPNNTGDFGRTIWGWIFAIYPDAPPAAEQIIYNKFIPVYNSMKSDFLKYNERANLNTAGSYVRIPKTIKGKRVHTVKDIVDIILDSIKV